ncbi:hypothetical protein KP509_11G054300 [Ceratopteris richardii]|nr:hypothetical protein KP509_11G054300 [Ceratopteris richardii]
MQIYNLALFKTRPRLWHSSPNRHSDRSGNQYMLASLDSAGCSMAHRYSEPCTEKASFSANLVVSHNLSRCAYDHEEIYAWLWRQRRFISSDSTLVVLF